MTAMPLGRMTNRRCQTNSGPASVDADEAEIRDPAFARRGEFDADPAARRELRRGLFVALAVRQVQSVDVVADRRIGAVEPDERDRDRGLALALEAAHDERRRF